MTKTKTAETAAEIMRVAHADAERAERAKTAAECDAAAKTAAAHAHAAEYAAAHAKRAAAARKGIATRAERANAADAAAKRAAADAAAKDAADAAAAAEYAADIAERAAAKYAKTAETKTAETAETKTAKTAKDEKETKTMENTKTAETAAAVKRAELRAAAKDAETAAKTAAKDAKDAKRAETAAAAKDAAERGANAAAAALTAARAAKTAKDAAAERDAAERADAAAEHAAAVHADAAADNAVRAEHDDLVNTAAYSDISGVSMVMVRTLSVYKHADNERVLFDTKGVVLPDAFIAPYALIAKCMDANTLGDVFPKYARGEMTFRAEFVQLFDAAVRDAQRHAKDTTWLNARAFELGESFVTRSSDGTPRAKRYSARAFMSDVIQPLMTRAAWSYAVDMYKVTTDNARHSVDIRTFEPIAVHSRGTSARGGAAFVDGRMTRKQRRIKRAAVNAAKKRAAEIIAAARADAETAKDAAAAVRDVAAECAHNYGLTDAERRAAFAEYVNAAAALTAAAA